MRIQNSNFSVAEIREMFDRKDLVVNKDYQRNPNLWPNNAKSYFIDTILNGYPFPKIYLYESLVGHTKKIRREIVDGQQRITTILEFLNDGFALSNASMKYRGARFSSLNDEDQTRFLTYSVPIDMILAAQRNEILEMFRRMNAYTQPLNPAEKRHSQFIGEFKWFVNELSDEYSPMLVNFGVLTQKQVVRMADAELLAEILQLVLTGIVNKSDATLLKLYQSNDEVFARSAECNEKVHSVLEFVRQNLGMFSGGFLFKSYALYSLCAALLYNRYGAPRWSNELPQSSGEFWNDELRAREGLAALAAAHETQDLQGPYAEYVAACLSTTHRVQQRTTRAWWHLRALRGELR